MKALSAKTIKPMLSLLWIFLLALPVFSQTIKGKVSDENKNPIPGVNVYLKGTNVGTITDFNGMYTISIENISNPILVFSFIGYSTQELPVEGKTTVDVFLKPSNESLDEIVVIGYGTVRKRDLTGSVSSIGQKQLKDIPVTSAAQAITGRLAGVHITTSEGSPDAEVKIRLRGGGSITQDNTPLIIVDGFPADRISDIAPSDIESIDVLKDASSAAIYGARGANGVIIITTKTGKQGKVRVNYNGYFGTKKLSKKFDLLSPHEYVLYQYERASTSFLDKRDFEGKFGAWEQYDELYSETEFIDWQGKVFGEDGASQYHNLSITGGSEKNSYSLSITHNDDNGIMMGTGYLRDNANFRFESKPTEKFSFKVDVRYSQQNIRGSGTSDPGTSSTNNLRHSVIYRPLELIIEDSDFSDEEYFEQSNLTDPVSLVNDDYRRKTRHYATFNTGISYNILKGLTFRSNFGIDTRNQRYDRFNGLSTYLARRYGDKPVVTVENDFSYKTRWSNILNYNMSNIQGLHDVDVVLGQEMIASNARSVDNESRSFPANVTPEIALGSLGLGEEYQRPSTFESSSKLFSYFGRVNYGFKGRYLGSFTLRADGSSKFAPGKRWGVFPSGSFAWRISEEAFMGNIPSLSNMKMRASYGQAGNNRIDDFLWTTTYGISSSKAYFLNEIETSYFHPKSLANPALKWETTISRNVGLDVGFWDNRLSATIDWYRNTTKDLLIQQRIPSVAGYSTQMMNIGQTSNYGFEFQLDAFIIQKGDFQLSANFNIAFNKNKVDDLGGVDYFTQASGWNADTGDDYMIKVGEPVGLMYGFVTDGFYAADEFEYDAANQVWIIKEGIANNEGILFDGFGPGAYKLKDLAQPLDENGNPVDDGNLVTFDDDRTIIGNAMPKHTGGVNLMAAYKGFDVSLFMNWVYGNDVYNANKIEFTSGYRRYTNLLSSMSGDKRWITINEEGDVVTDTEILAEMNKDAIMWKPPTGRYLFHSWAVEDGSFLRINNLTIGYSLPQNWIQKIKIQKLRLYFTANNLHTFTNYSGYDPEVDTRRKTPLTPSVDYSAYPRSKSFIFGMNLTL